LLIVAGLTGAALATNKAGGHAFTRTDVAARIGPREEVAKGTDSLSGPGAAVVELKGTTATVTSYFANGLSIVTDRSTSTPPKQSSTPEP
jgi:hypothetical protein